MIFRYESTTSQRTLSSTFCKSHKYNTRPKPAKEFPQVPVQEKRKCKVFNSKNEVKINVSKL